MDRLIEVISEIERGIDSLCQQGEKSTLMCREVDEEPEEDL